MTQSYFANGAPDVLSNLTGLPTITYDVDGEGRVSSVSASSGQNPVSSTVYNTASEPKTVTYGSTDSDAFSYDSNSGRMTQYQFNVGSHSVVGVLSWNGNGSLEQLAITDPINSANQQTCSYTHDDLSRIASASCTGSAFSGMYSYDPFGNLTKTGTDTFNATYNPATNQMSSIGGQTPTYDSNGNVLNDFLNTYSWDADGRPVTVDGVSVTYDAPGRIVEEYNGTTYSEFVYGPSGAKLAIMAGQSLTKAFVPLVGGAVAEYHSGGTLYYRRPDWLGSVRFVSTTTRTTYADEAYGPFGEPYAGSGTTDLSFTGMNQDTASNVYDFPMRAYGIQGRWPSPDPAGLAAVDPTDPQSWDRYAYVRNSPLEFADPLGLCGGPSAGTSQSGTIQGYGGLPCNPLGPTNNQGGCNPGSSFQVISIGGVLMAGCAPPEGSDWQQEVELGIAEQEAYQSSQQTPGASGVSGGGSSTGGTPTEPSGPIVRGDMDIWHCPGCANEWNQLDCTINGSLDTTAGSAAEGATASAVTGGINAGSGSFWKGAWGAVEEGAVSTGALIYTYGSTMVRIGWRMTQGCHE